jgi:translocation and assembly module TamB
MADELLPVSIPWWRRWRFRFAALAVTLVVLVGFAPTIVARTPLHSWLIARATSDIHGSVHVGSASFGWISEPELRDVELRDEQGKTILTTPRVQVGRTLIGLVFDHSDLGTITVESPVVNLVAKGDETNLEHALAAYMEGESASSTRMAMRVAITKGTLTLDDEDTKQNWSASELDATVEIPADRKAAMKVTGQGSVKSGERPRKATLTIEYRSGKGGPGLPPQVHAEATTEGLPVAALAAFLRRFEPGLRLGGTVSGSLSLTWNDEDPDSPALALSGQVSGVGLSAADPRLGDEKIELASFEMPCNVTWVNGRLIADKTSVNCDVGKISLSGTIDLSKDPFAVLQTPNVTASCDVDLAQLSRLLPKQFRLQQGTSITSGRLTGEVHSIAEKDGVTWSGRLLALDLRGEHAGQPIAWENPVSVDFAARQGPNALPRVDRFRLLSEFGKLEASGTEEQLTVGGNIDLSLLAKRLAQFVDLGAVSPAGTAGGQVTLTRDHGGVFGVKGEVRLQDLNVALGSRSLREKDLRLTIDAVGRVKGPAYRLETGGLHLFSGTDHVDVDLLEPIVDLAYLRSGYVRLGLHGDLNRWKSWAGQVAGLPAEWQAGGDADASARLRLTPESLDLDSAIATLNNLRFVGAGLNVNEPQLTVKPGSIKWDRKAGKVEVHDAVVACSAGGVRFDTLTADLNAKGGPGVSGHGRVQGDAAKIQKWVPSLATEPLAGTLDGTIDLSTDAGRISGGAELSVRSLVVGDPAKPTWNEPLVRVTARGRFDSDADLAVIDEIKLESAAFGGTVTGRLAKLSTTCDLMLTGSIAYDLERWEPQLRHFLGKDARVQGRDRKAFRVEGSLASGQPPQVNASASANPVAGLKGEVALGWQAVQAYGCAVGSASVSAKMLGDGWVRFDPIETTFNQGKLKLLPFIRLDPAPTILAFAKGTGVDRAKLTSAMSDGSLGYVAPMLAGLRDADGEISFTIDGGQIPLGDPMKTDVWGKIIIHSAKATPGPVMSELAAAIKLPLNMSLSRELTIPFRVVNGRVYHKDLDIPFGEVTVRTNGSVGLDGSLSIVAEFPVPARWLGKNAPKNAPTIKLPIGGTLSSPHVDEKALQQILAQYTIDAAGDAVKREVEKGIKGWFGTPKK